MIEHTPPNHPDFPLLKEAEKVMHDFAIKLGTVNESQHEEDQQATLKRLELLLITDVSYQNFLYKTVDFWYDVTIYLSWNDSGHKWNLRRI